MSWELEACIDLEGQEASANLAGAFAASFGPALASLECKEYGPGWDWRNQPLTTHELDPAANHESLFRQLAARLIDADRFVEIEAGVGLEASQLPAAPIRLYLFGTKHVGTSMQGRRSDALISFCNRQRYRGRNTTITGEVVDELYLVRLLTRICDQAVPRSLYVDNEEGVRIPFNYHMVFHSSYDGFRDDLREIARMSLWGGQGHTDARSRYEPLLSPEANPMLFCRRRDTRLTDLTDFLRDRVELLEAITAGLEIPDELIDAAVFDSQRIEPMDTARGIGIVGEPFLRDYCESFYFHILGHLPLL